MSAMAAAVFEARMTRAQQEELADLMREGRATRPAGVVTALLLADGELTRLVAVWRDRDTLDRYLAEVDVPRGEELMRRAGAVPTMRIADALELG